MTSLSEAAARLARSAMALKKRREKDALTRKHQKKIAAFFRQQKAAVLEDLGKNRHLFSESYRKLAEESPVDLTLQNWDRIWEMISNDTSGELQKVIFNAEVEGVVWGAENLKKAIPLFDKKSSFNLANPRAVKWFQDNGGSVDRIKGIQQTTGDSLKRVIGTAIDEGWAYTQTAKEIRKLFDGPISRDRAQRIAVFESGQAYEAGNMLFAQSLKDDGVRMEKMWMTSHDEKVRPEHAANEAEGWIPIDQIHQTGHQEPPTDPGCRCYEIYREAPGS